MIELTTAWMLGCVCGFFMGATMAGRRPTCRELMRERDPDWRRSINHENTNQPSGPPPLLYQPRSQGGTPNPPPSDP